MGECIMSYVSNILNYIDWRGDLDFAQSSFNEVDALIFSALSYVEFDQIVPPDFSDEITLKDAYDQFMTHQDDEKYSKLGLMIPDEIFELFQKMSQSLRYKNLRLFDYKEYKDVDHEVQFAAIVFQNDLYENMVVYRGTDDSIVGWKEDFNLGFMDVIPAQKMALDYLNEIGENCYGTYYVCGHSKGGNLAVYAACLCDEAIQSNIIGIYNMDGPGFSREFLMANAYQRVNRRTYWYLPHESIVGTLLNHGTMQYVVECSSKGGVFQHNPFMWHVENTHFIYEQFLSEDAIKVHVAVEQCLQKLTKEELRDVTNYIFEGVAASDANNLSDLGIRNMIHIVDTIKNLDDDAKTAIKEVMMMVLKAYIRA